MGAKMTCPNAAHAKNQTPSRIPSSITPNTLPCPWTNKETKPCGQLGISHQSMFCKNPCSHLGPLCSSPPPSLSGRLQDRLHFFGISCGAGYEVMALNGGTRTEHSFHDSNSISQPRHPGNLFSPWAPGLPGQQEKPACSIL